MLSAVQLISESKERSHLKFMTEMMPIINLTETCTFGALVNQTRRSYTDLTCPFGILEAYTFGRVNLSKSYLANGIRPRLLSAAER